MKITIVGTGYVGLVTGLCLADTGNDVLGLDILEDKVRRLNAGECPIFEPGLLELLKSNLAKRRFEATLDTKRAVEHAEIIFITIGTPPDDNGKADTRMIDKAVQDIARLVNKPTLLVLKSTVPVGTSARVEALVRPLTKHPITLVSNPEFLKEGSAVGDFLHPDRIVIGAEDRDAENIMRDLYEPFVVDTDRILLVKRAAAEMIKYASNCYLSTRISFINQIANICEKKGIDINEVRRGMGYDARIGSHFLSPGIGYGGSCFPKDVQALAAVAEEIGVPHFLLDAVHAFNEDQKKLLFRRIENHFAEPLSGKTFAIWGVAFKPKTDDIREAPALVIIDLLLAAGAKARVHDPKALENLVVEKDRQGRPYNDRLDVSPDIYETTRGADALIICTEWNEFRTPDFDKLKKLLKSPLIFDGRNLYDPDHMRHRGFDYYSIGRPPVLRKP